MSLEFKIGMIAPSRAGKTSLMTAIFHEMQKKLSGNAQGIQYWADSKATQNAISRALAEFQTCTAGDDVFEVPQIKSTESSANYKFAVSVPVRAGTQRVNIDIMDYPGGLLGTPEFTAAVMPHLNSSNVLLVPIPADVLMEWKRTHGVNNPHSKKTNIIARCMLDVDNVVTVIQDWMHSKERKHEAAMLFLVPIKCEVNFSDNGGSRDDSADLHEAVKTLYIHPLDMTPEMRNLIQIETHAVDTYGIVELRDIALDEIANEEVLVSTFRKRLSSDNKIHSRGALEILAGIINFRLGCFAKTLNMSKMELEQKIADRSFFGNIWAWITGDPLKQSVVDHVRQHDAAYQAMTVIVNLKQSYPARQRIHNEIEV